MSRVTVEPQLRAALWVSLAFASTQPACTGDIDTARRAPPGTVGLPGAAGSSAAPGAADPSAADEAMRAQDPELFEIAAKYFPGQSAAAPAKRLFRLTRAQLDATARSLLPKSYGDSLLESMPRDPLETNYEYADNLSWNAANFTPYTTWVGALVERVRLDPKSVIDCTAQGDSTQCQEQQARRFVTRAFRGATADAQLQRYAAFFTAGATEVGVANATAELVDVTLTSPSFLFREEVQTDAGSYLLPAQRLQNLSYALADAPPEAVGLSPDMAAALVDAGALQRTVDQVLATEAARDKLVRFFIAWLEVKEPDEFTIAQNVFPEFTPEVAAAAVEETRQFLEHQLSVAAPTLKAITQATQSFVSEAVAGLYGVRAAPAGTLAALDPAQRLGIFTQPAVIASHSGPTTTRLVKRGVFFTRKVMCLPLGAPPDGVDTTIPEMAGATERQRVEAITSRQPCTGCHQFINPFGFTHENYDAIGRWRTRDEAGLAIDPSISIDFLDEGPLATNSPVDALRGFTGSARFKQCFARQLFRFYMGRDEESGDDPLLRQMFFAFANGDGQDIVGMLRILAGSPTFNQRAEAP